MKIKNKIIGIILINIVVLNLFLNTNIAFAQSDNNYYEDYKEIIEKTGCKAPEFDTKNINVESYKKVMDQIEIDQKNYHEYVQCIFDYMEDEILINKTTGTDGKWFDPKRACLSDDKINEILKNNSTETLVELLLDINILYKDYLDEFKNVYFERGELTSGENFINAIEKANKNLQGSKKLNKFIEDEKENSLIAIDLGLIMLKELRLAFLMHVRFQCMLSYLDDYRELLKKIRTIVECLPKHLEDASISG